jgi:hypothetical protein
MYSVKAKDANEAIDKMVAVQLGNRPLEWTKHVMTNDVDVKRVCPDGTLIQEL